MNNCFLKIISLSAFIFIGLGGSKGVCELDSCQQNVVNICMDELVWEVEKCNDLVSTVPTDKCKAFYDCLRECPSLLSSSCAGPSNEMRECMRARSQTINTCRKNCFKQNVVPWPSWLTLITKLKLDQTNPVILNPNGHLALFERQGCIPKDFASPPFKGRNLRISRAGDRL